MLFHTHLLIGILFFLALGDMFSGGSKVVFFIIVMLGSILPDIDSKESKISQAAGPFSFFGRIFKHRGMLHSLLFGLILFFIMSYFWNDYYATALFIGFFAHLTGDMITPQGIKLFYPFLKFRIRGPIRTGGIGEWIIVLFVILGIIKLIF